jgi:hypothetical protein
MYSIPLLIARADDKQYIDLPSIPLYPISKLLSDYDFIIRLAKTQMGA